MYNVHILKVLYILINFNIKQINYINSPQQVFFGYDLGLYCFYFCRFTNDIYRFLVIYVLTHYLKNFSKRSRHSPQRRSVRFEGRETNL